MIINIISPGAAFANNGSDFTVWAPTKKQVVLLLEASPGSGSGETRDQTPDAGSRIPMTASPEGYWRVRTGAQPGQRYRYLVDGKGPFPDPASRHQPEGVHGASAVVDSKEFKWKDDQWKSIPRAGMVIMEMHTGTFSDLHSFAGIQGRLDYLVNLGVNTIELMPVAQFPGKRNWGYDAVFPFAVAQAYGGPDGLKMLVNEAHSKGIAVILDVVYNHLGPEGNILGEFGPYFTGKYNNFWGASLNFDDAYSDGVKNYFIANAMMWLDEFHIDGLRLDAVHAVKDFSSNHVMEELSQAVRALERRTGVPKQLIAELDLNDPRYIRPVSAGGYGLDAQWLDEFHHALHTVVTGERSGYYEDFGQLEQLAKSYRESYVYNGNYSVHRKRRFGSDASAQGNDQFVVFAQNHDQIGNRVKGDRLSLSLSFPALRLTAAAVLLSPFIPLLFMGEEYGETNPFYFFVDHSDPDLLAAVNKGRREEFAYFKHEIDFPDPTSKDAFSDSVLSWDYRNPERDRLMRWYQYLIGLRKAHPALGSQKREDLSAHIVSGSVLCLERRVGEKRLTGWMNFSAAEREADLPEGNWKLLADASATEWLPGQVFEIESRKIRLAAWGVRLYQNTE